MLNQKSILSSKVQSDVKNGSLIRTMFEEGEKLRKIHVSSNVFDFSLGNPDYEPPIEVIDSMKKYLGNNYTGVHKYMSNSGHEDVRSKIAASISIQTNLPLDSKHIIMTCGAAGGLNVVLKTILNPGDEVIVLAPYFVEYKFYTENHGGKLVVSNCSKETFEPDVLNLESTINRNTKAIIINSPNNPTGVIYSELILKEIYDLITRKEKELGINILVISDEPYAKLVYDNYKVPNILNIFSNSVLINSYSKSLALPGERIGFIALSPSCIECESLIDGMIFANRTLGYVNAPSLFQKVAADCIDISINTSEYQERRDFFYKNLIKCGFECIKPNGAFYFFPKSPIPDDVEFTKAALKYNLLLVPGRAFGCPGFFRIAYCVSMDTIKNSITAFKKLMQEYT
jgi:aspartate aminotransferase